MALIGNRSIFHKSPCRHLSGRVASGDRNNFSKQGMLRNSAQALGLLAAIPSGNTAPISWSMARRAGALSARYAVSIDVDSAGLAWAGFPIEGSTSLDVTVSDATVFPLDDTPPTRTASAQFFITVPDATAQLISTANGTASVLVSTNNPLLTASVNAVGTATLLIDVPPAILGALADLVAISAINVFAVSSILPTNDSSPLRNGSATVALSGALTPYAIGQLIGSTEGGGVMTEKTIASEVWSSVAAEFDAAGTMGEKLNGAGSAGNPWTEIIESGLSAAQVLRLILAVQSGETTITDLGGGSATVVFKSVDGVKNRITADLVNSERVAVTVDAS